MIGGSTHPVRFNFLVVKVPFGGANLIFWSVLWSPVVPRPIKKFQERRQVWEAAASAYWLWVADCHHRGRHVKSPGKRLVNI